MNDIKLTSDKIGKEEVKKQRQKLLEDFLHTFPLNSLQGMTLEQYTNLNKDDSFCYCLEFHTYELGSIGGGASSKFGIYKYQNKPTAKANRITYDSKYAWYTKYNKATAQEAFKVVKNAIIKIATYANTNCYEAIDPISELGDALKWKIAYLYSNNQLVPIYKKDMLVKLATLFGLVDAKAMPISKLQTFLIQQKGDKDIFDYYEELLTILKESDYGQTTDTTNGTEDDIDKQYWWLVASPKIWSSSKMKVGDIEDYTLYNENGNPRRVFQNFVNAKKGDIVIGYEANPVKQIVAIAEIDTPSDGQHICFKKIESLQYPIDYATFKDAQELKSMEFIQNKNGSLFKVTSDEYEYLIDLIRESNPKEDNKQLESYTKRTTSKTNQESNSSNSTKTTAMRIS